MQHHVQHHVQHHARISAAVTSVAVASTALIAGTPETAVAAPTVTATASAAPAVARPAGAAPGVAAVPTAVVPGRVYGPRAAPACSGVVIKPGQEAQDVIARYGAITRFCFAAGLHRVNKTIQPKYGMILASKAGAVLTGSVRLTSWTPTSGDWMAKGALPPAYAKSGQCENNVTNICSLREQLFRNGVHLTRVATRAAVVPGTFYADYAADVIYVGSNPAGAAMEMSRTRTAISANVSRVTVRGLTIEHFASAPQGGAVVVGPGWNVYANDVRHNHAVGVMLVNADNATLSLNLINNNGQLGVGQYSTVNGTIAANSIAGNNTDGFWIADWESGGIKTTWSSRGIVRDNLIRANRGVGLWSDAYDENRTLTGNRIESNYADGIRFEIGRNSIITANTIIANGFGTRRGSGTSLWDGAGLNINTSRNVIAEGNYLAGNVNGVTIQSRTRGSGPWGVNLLRDVVVKHNSIHMRGGTQATGMVQNSGSPLPAGEGVYQTNRYTLDSRAAKRFQRFGTWYTSVSWKSAGQDIGSVYVVG